MGRVCVSWGRGLKGQERDELNNDEKKSKQLSGFCKAIWFEVSLFIDFLDSFTAHVHSKSFVSSIFIRTTHHTPPPPLSYRGGFPT